MFSFPSLGSGIPEKTKQFLREYSFKSYSFRFRNDISDFTLSISGSVSTFESCILGLLRMSVVIIVEVYNFSK